MLNPEGRLPIKPVMNVHLCGTEIHYRKVTLSLDLLSRRARFPNAANEASRATRLAHNANEKKEKGKKGGGVII